jgi:hypothetical protein
MDVGDDLMDERRMQDRIYCGWEVSERVFIRGVLRDIADCGGAFRGLDVAF